LPFVHDVLHRNQARAKNHRNEEEDRAYYDRLPTNQENRERCRPGRCQKGDHSALQPPILPNQFQHYIRLHAFTSSRLRSTLATNISSSVMFSTACTRTPEFSYSLGRWGMKALAVATASRPDCRTPMIPGRGGSTTPSGTSRRSRRQRSR